VIFTILIFHTGKPSSLQALLLQRSLLSALFVSDIEGVLLGYQLHWRRHRNYPTTPNHSMNLLIELRHFKKDRRGTRLTTW
jgi:hypothetical protein